MKFGMGIEFGFHSSEHNFIADLIPIGSERYGFDSAQFSGFFGSLGLDNFVLMGGASEFFRLIVVLCGLIEVVIQMKTKQCEIGEFAKRFILGVKIDGVGEV